MNKIKTAFIGCGGIAEHYVGVYRDLDWVEMTVCVDSDLSRARKIAGMTNTEPRITENYTDALTGEVDVIVINTPNHVHREQTIAALDAGKHVLLQKPVAATYAEAQIIAEAARRARLRGIHCGLYLSYFDQPLVYDFRSMIEVGWFGEITHLSARLMHRGGLAISRQIAEGKQNWRGSSTQTGGGCFIQHAVHFINLFRWLIRSKVVRAAAMTGRQQCAGIEGEDISSAIVEFENGVLATMDFAWNTSGEQLSIRGTEGTADYLNNNFLLLESSAGKFHGLAVNYEENNSPARPGAPGLAGKQNISFVTAPALDDINNPFNQHKLFLEAVRDHREPFGSIEAGVDDLRIVQAVYDSARSERTIHLVS